MLAEVGSLRVFRATSAGMPRAAFLAIALFACGGGATPQPTKKDGGTPDAAVVEVSAKQLGMPDLASYAWRKRGGHPAFKVARKAEAGDDWKTVVTTCQQALAADPGHLEAAYLLAAGLGKLGKHDALLGPLQLAAAGDFGKWGPASLELPALQAFLASPVGEAWRRRVEQDRSSYVAALARSLVVTSEGDLFAFDPDGPRWYRLTRTHGAVISAFRVAPTKIAFVTRQRDKNRKITLAIGLADITRGKTSRAVELDTKGPITLAVPPDGNGVYVAIGPQRAIWKRLDDNFKLSALPAKTTRPPGPVLEVKGKTPRLRALPVPGVTADWDDKGLASAIRIGKSNRVVSVPAPGLIDGHTATWSPDRSRIAFVAQLDDRCKPDVPNAAVFVADATTGALTELERGSDGLAVAWVGDRKLALAGDKGVTLLDLDGDAPASLAGADGLIAPRHRSICTPDPADPTDEPPADPDAPESAAGEPTDAKVVEPP